jgi:hypothetical protein
MSAEIIAGGKHTVILRLPQTPRVALRVTPTKMAITEERWVRHWLFWQRYQVTVLAEGPHQISAGDQVDFRASPRRYAALVNGEMVLSYRRPETDLSVSALSPSPGGWAVPLRRWCS